MRVKEIFQNLLGNAIKYTESGTITLSLGGEREENRYKIRLSVQDTGVGMDETDAEQIFQRFKRTKNARTEKEAAILRAEAKKEAMIREAEGRAQAIEAVQRATAEGIRFLNEADPSKAVLTIKSLEAFEKAADGKATKIIIPSEIQGVAGLAKAVVESVKETE